MTIYKDDRTAEQRLTHPYLIVGTDAFMSGWGEASGGYSYAAWACNADQVDRVDQWVRSRSEMKRVRFIDERYGKYRPTGCAHLHVYVVNDDHPALRGAT